MKPILVDDRLDLGEFGDLVDQRFGVVTGEFMTTTATIRRLALDRLTDLLGRDQRAMCLAMPVLAAALFPAARCGRFPLHPDRIGRGGLGRVGGIELEPILEINESVLKESDAFLIKVHDGEECRLQLR
jgi:hypothetical protein